MPQFPDDLQPAVGQAAVGVVLGEAAGAATGEIGGSPLGFRDGADGELLSGMAVVVVAGFAETDASSTVALDGDCLLYTSPSPRD